MYVSNSSLTKCETEAYMRGNIYTHGNLVESGKEKRRNMSEMLENYFRIGSMKNKHHKIDEHLRTMIRIIIWKQWKTAKKREWGLPKLGVEKWIEYKVANWGNRYQLVATKSVVKIEISKEILTKRGLISISDYYQKVAHI